MADNIEYTEINNNLRNYSNLRFAQLTIFAAITGALIVFFFDKDNHISFSVRRYFEIAGLLVAFLFLIMEESATSKWRALKERAIEIEKDLGFKQWQNFPQERIFSATYAMRALYVSTGIFWVAIFLCYEN